MIEKTTRGFSAKRGAATLLFFYALLATDRCRSRQSAAQGTRTRDLGVRAEGEAAAVG